MTAVKGIRMYPHERRFAASFGLCRLMHKLQYGARIHGGSARS